jgi:hypothetical protein
VMETLGHSRISVTLDTYTHVMPALQKEAANAMDQMLAGSHGHSSRGEGRAPSNELEFDR